MKNNNVFILLLLFLMIIDFISVCYIQHSLLTNRARGPYWGILARGRGSTDRGPIFPSTALASSVSK